MVDLVELKSGHVALQGPGRILRGAAADGMQDAERLLADAELRAADMVASAQAQVDAIQAAARAAGIEEATEEIQDRLFAIAEASANAISRTEERIIDMAMHIARRIIGAFDEAEIAARVAKKSLALSAHSGFIRLRVAPSAVEPLRERLDAILPTAMSSAAIEVIGDGRVHGGGCIMETDAGLIDATIDSQLAAIERGLRRSLNDTVAREA
ncbi:MAG: FliH/SctL family protein [Acetobacteraceae bacterium]